MVHKQHHYTLLPKGISKYPHFTFLILSRYNEMSALWRTNFLRACDIYGEILNAFSPRIFTARFKFVYWLGCRLEASQRKLLKPPSSQQQTRLRTLIAMTPQTNQIPTRILMNRTHYSFLIAISSTLRFAIWKHAWNVCVRPKSRGRGNVNL